MAFEPVLPDGATFADYVIDGVIARGGMGVVYRATQLQPRRRVALKLIAPERAADPAYRDRFLREMDSLASLEHPNIVPIHAAGEWQGQLYLAMRLVDGPDLGALIAREGPMSVDRALSILGPVAAALEAAHAEGLVHRDVKPANILVDGRGAVYLTDFGLTKRSISETGPTMPGQAIGSPGYMSPEQFTTGLSQDPVLAARTDQYALGCVLYACLTGKEPYHRDTWEAAMWAHVYAPIPRLSERRPDLPADLDSVMEVALAKDPQARFPSVTAFIEAAREAVPAAARASVPPRAVAPPAPVTPPVTPPAFRPAGAPAPDESAPAVPAPDVPDAPLERRRVSDVLAAAAAQPAVGGETIVESISAGVPASVAPAPALEPPAPPPSLAAPRVSPSPPGSAGSAPPTATPPVRAPDPTTPDPTTAVDGDETVIATVPGWGSKRPGGTGGSSGTTPVVPPRRRDPWTVAAVGVTVGGVLLVAALAFGSGLIGDGAASPSAPGSTAVAGASFTPRPTSRPTPTTPPPSVVIATDAPTADTGSSPSPGTGAAYEALIAEIPDTIRTTCQPIELPPAIASTFCNDASGRPVFYSTFADQGSLDSEYETWRSYYKAPKDTGSCKSDTAAESTWSYTGSTQDPKGRLMCTAVKDNLRKFVLAWTIDAKLMYVELWGDDQPALYKSWLNDEVMPS